MNHHAIIIALSATITDLNKQVACLEEVCDGQSHLLDLSELAMSGKEEEIESLRGSLDHLHHEADQSYSHQRQLEDKVYRLEQDLKELRLQDPATRERGNAYMATIGRTLRSTYPGEEHRFSKIEAVKGVREITGFGLKESKDLVEAWMAAHPLECQDDPKPVVTNCG